MQTHPYVRAYMAGIVVPTLFLLVVVAIDAYQKYYFEVSFGARQDWTAFALER